MSTFTDEQKSALAAPLDRAVVKKNPKGFDYVEAWHAIAEANRIFGFDAWNRETVEMRLLGGPRQTGDTWRVGYFAKVRITVGDVIREGCGFGSGINRDVDQAHEGALKEAESDAMKRALMTFGNPFGLALYDKAKMNVEGEDKPPPAQDQRRQQPAQQAQPPRQAAPAVLPIAERAKVLCGTMRAAAQTGDRAKLQHVWDRGAVLRKEMDAKEPELLFDAEVLFKELCDRLDEQVAA